MWPAPDSVVGFILLERLWAKVEILGPDECWPWVGATDPHGRGRINFQGRAVLPTHIILHFDGRPRPKVPDDKALHNPLCRPSCSNPKHLRWGSQQDNMKDKILHNRQSHTCGTALKKSTLTEQDIRDIRTSTFTLEEQAKLYDISSRSVWDIKHRKSWKHVLD